MVELSGEKLFLMWTVDLMFKQLRTEVYPEQDEKKYVFVLIKPFMT